MKLIHISDIHLTENGHQIWEVNTLEHFCSAIQKIKSLDSVDGIIVSGDLSDDGSRWSYEYIDRAFAEIGIPTFCCPGNHDNLNTFFGGYEPRFYKIPELVEIGDWSFILLNSAVTGMSRGYFNIEKLKGLLERSHGNTTVVLHHPPIEQEGWLNRKLLENRDEFNDIILHTENVRLVLYGHTHYHTNSIINGVVYSSAPSTGFAFNPNSQKFKIVSGEEGFNIIEIKNDDIMIAKVNLQSL
ncbi:metallophosphoesterase [Parabacteroides sp. ZJ-118]|uniref:metallophosphoesterase family protein n=1 Tax=Parabacteroides sp. ZJ-118 TaxID=2709398 RepID=UPI0013ECE0F4|nr:metallophosphoesterase [Parabacteroides sp. ZJ-118]